MIDLAPLILALVLLNISALGQETEEYTTTTTTTAEGLPMYTTTTTTYSILSSFDPQPDNSDFTQGTHVTIFSERTLPTNYQNLYVEISSTYGEESLIGITYYDIKPLKSGLNLANPIKEGVIFFSVDESADIDYDNIAILVNDGNIYWDESRCFPVYDYFKYRELPSIYNNEINDKFMEDISNFLPSTVDTTINIIKDVKKIPVPIVSPLIQTISMTKDTRKALKDLGWLPYITLGDNIDETEFMTKEHSNILNTRDIIQVPWNTETDFLYASKAYESVVIRIPIRINDQKNNQIYIHGIYICESPTPQSGRSSTVNFYSKIELPYDFEASEIIDEPSLEENLSQNINLEKFAISINWDIIIGFYADCTVILSNNGNKDGKAIVTIVDDCGNEFESFVMEVPKKNTVSRKFRTNVHMTTEKLFCDLKPIDT